MEGTGPYASLLRQPLGAAIHWASGDVIVADTGNNRLRRVSRSSGAVTTLAGMGTAGYVDSPSTAAALFNAPSDVAVSNASASEAVVFVADSLNHVIRRTALRDGATTTVAGFGRVAAWRDGPALTSYLNSPRGLVLSQADSVLYICDTANHRVRALASGFLTTLAGTGAATWSDGTGTAAAFSSPRGITLDPVARVLYVADTGNHRIRSLALGTSQVTTIAGGSSVGWAEGTGAAAWFYSPYDVEYDAAQGRLLVADYNNFRVRAIALAGGVYTTSTLTGSGASTTVVNTALAAASLALPASVAVSSNPAWGAFIVDSSMLHGVACAGGGVAAGRAAPVPRPPPPPPPPPKPAKC
jgi:hypothetical protein